MVWVDNFIIMFFYLFVFILGACIGSFLNVVILRTHSQEKIAKSRSRCPYCKHDLGINDLIPIFSFVAQQAKCRYCKKKISWQYPVVELITGFLFVLATYNIIGGLGFEYLFYNSSVWLGWLRDFIFISYLVVIFVYDLRWYLILDRITIPAMMIAVILNLWLGFTWQTLLVGFLIGLGFFVFQYVVSRGKWIGGGDLRMGALMGLMLGAKGVVVALFLSYVIGAIVSLFLVAYSKKKFKSEIPFGTFLAIGTLIALLWGNQIITWYFSLF